MMADIRISDLLTPFLLALVAALLWHYEANIVLRATDDSWLQAHHWSPYLVLACATTAFLLPFHRYRRLRPADLLSAGIEIYLILVVAYYLARTILFSLYTGFSGWLSPRMLWFVLAGVLLMSAYNIWLSTRRRLGGISPGQWWLLLAVLIGPLPLAWLTTQLLGIDSEPLVLIRTGLIHFYFVLLAGLLALQLTATVRRPLRPEQEDVLDDVGYRP